MSPLFMPLYPLTSVAIDSISTIKRNNSRSLELNTTCESLNHGRTYYSMPNEADIIMKSSKVDHA